MKQTIDVKGYTFEYDKEKLIKEIEELKWETNTWDEIDEDTGEPIEDEDRENIYNTPSKDWDQIKSDFIKEIQSPKFEELIPQGIHITKKGTLAQNRRNIILESGLCYGCHAPYGSFFYDEYVIRAAGNQIILDSVQQNQSF